MPYDRVMNEQKKQKREITPPYLSVSKIEELIRLVSSRNFNEVSVKLFRNYGFNESDAVLAVSTLKFLGAIDEENKTSEIMAKFRLQGDVRKKEFEKILRQSYSKLFETIATPESLPVEELANEFYAQYNVTPRVARSAIPAFLKLCEYAGLKEVGSVATRKRVSKSGASKIPNSASSTQKNHKTIVLEHPPGLESFPVAQGRMVLSIPSNLKNRLLDDETITEDWKLVSLALKKFADTYIPKETEATEEAQSS